MTNFLRDVDVCNQCLVRGSGPGSVQLRQTTSLRPSRQRQAGLQAQRRIRCLLRTKLKQQPSWSMESQASFRMGWKPGHLGPRVQSWCSFPSPEKLELPPARMQSRVTPQVTQWTSPPSGQNPRIVCGALEGSDAQERLGVFPFLWCCALCTCLCCACRPALQPSTQAVFRKSGRRFPVLRRAGWQSRAGQRSGASAACSTGTGL